jgi:hypothetical protein
MLLFLILLLCRELVCYLLGIDDSESIALAFSDEDKVEIGDNVQVNGCCLLWRLLFHWVNPVHCHCFGP